MDGGHVKALDKAIQKARMEIGIAALWVIDQFFVKRLGLKEDEPRLLIHKGLIASGPPPLNLNIHAEAYETSFMWHYLPDLVNYEVLKTLKPTNLTLKDLEVWSRGGSEARRVTPQGYFGDPAAADPERGRIEIETLGKVAAEAISAFLQSH
jgi:creatinine amidohydrolase